MGHFKARWKFSIHNINVLYSVSLIFSILEKKFSDITEVCKHSDVTVWIISGPAQNKQKCRDHSNIRRH